ncbi:hypothetical protein HUG10_19300 (plasmid) [Halorarum halophilum]|uniref:Uncharacterized protein n=1 Tax=Halorarum halophilum TaxID=2743090 RepID=A0A7D5H3J4_9EURY|nr:hypothetical protein [Halobaculum halophilum]QLG29753.1 hypothetical protein HUG10_19300 [Halobaculum halophilum]
MTRDSTRNGFESEVEQTEADDVGTEGTTSRERLPGRTGPRARRAHLDTEGA